MSSLAVMDAMTELSPNAAKCREVTLKLCWPHLQQDQDGSDAATAYGAGGEATGLVPNLGDGEAASMMSGYDAWCELMSTTGGVPLWQWPNVDDQSLNFFYGAGGGPYNQ